MKPQSPRVPAPACFPPPALAALVVLIFAGCHSPTSRVESAARSRPNFIFILTDDQRFDAMGCAGNRWIQTPNIDRLAARGVRFRNHFVTTAICCVSRASIFTGQYERRHGIGDFATPLSGAQWTETYPALLRTAGYRTGFIGKFGVGNAREIAGRGRDFDFWRGLPGQAGEWFIDPKDPTHTHATAKFGSEALEFLDACRAHQPFCLSLSFNSPHARDGKPREFQPDLRDETLYSDVEITSTITVRKSFRRAKVSGRTAGPTCDGSRPIRRWKSCTMCRQIHWNDSIW